MGNTQSSQHTGQIVDSQKTQSAQIKQHAIFVTVINCPEGQTLTAVCTSNTNVKQGFEGFESFRSYGTGLGSYDNTGMPHSFNMPNWVLPMLYIIMIILFFLMIIGSTYEHNFSFQNKVTSL